MSESGLSEASDGAAGSGKNAELTAGAMMRQAREAAGLHVAALAVAMKIPVKKLEALESDRLDLLHDAVFVRALASSVCRTLKMDPVPILAKLPSNAAPRLNPDERGINAPFHAPGDVAALPIPALLTKPPALIVMALLLGILVVIFLPEKKVFESPQEQTLALPKIASGQDQLPSERPALEPPTQSVQQEPVALASSSPVVSGASSQSPVVAVREPANTPGVPITAVSSSVAPTATANRVPADVATSATSAVVFKARAASWVKVVDSKGVVQLSKTMAEGEVIHVPGVLPLSVVIGRADAVDVDVRGKSFGLAEIAKENVARFEVK